MQIIIGTICLLCFLVLLAIQNRILDIVALKYEGLTFVLLFVVMICLLTAAIIIFGPYC